MKAAVLKENGILRYEEIPLREIPGWYRIRIAFAGICGSDLGRGFKNGAYHYPLVMGHEFSGVVETVPEGGKYPAGTRAAIYPLLPCGKCEPCRHGLIQLCTHYDYFGSRRDGAFAQYLYVPEASIVPMPDRVSLEEAALSEPAAVAHHAVYSHPVPPDAAALVIGGGPVGLLAGQWLKIRGCRRVTVADVQQEKLDFAGKLGFDPVNSAELGKLDSAFDICVEACGLSVTRNAAVSRCARQGHVFLIGNPAGTLEMEPKVYSSILRKEVSFSGSWNSLPDPDWTAVLAHAGAGLDLKSLITTTRPLSRAEETFQRILAGNSFQCKTLLNCQE